MQSAVDVKGQTTALEAKRVQKRRGTWQLHVMLLPALIIVLIFQYVPMLGLVMAFQDYEPWLGFLRSPWVGLEHFRTMFEYEDARQVIWNTLVISTLKIIFNLGVPLAFALLLNEVYVMKFKRTVQTIVYLPHFLSWVILGGILIDMLSPEGGLLTVFYQYSVLSLFSSSEITIGFVPLLSLQMCGKNADLTRLYF